MSSELYGTTIVGIELADGRVVMAADSQQSTMDGLGEMSRCPKIFTRRTFPQVSLAELPTQQPPPTVYLLGVAGSVRAANLLEHTWNPPTFLEPFGDSFVYRAVVESMRSLFKEYGHTMLDEGQENHEACILLALRGKLYTIYADYSVTQSMMPYAAIGSGNSFALGSLYTSDMIHNDLTADVDAAQMAARIAVRAASEFSVWSGGECVVEVLNA
jgi:ATP-dependent protease HslVU (ClpYQ) peptidase subunit